MARAFQALKQRNTFLVLFGLFAAFGGWLIWRCYHDPRITFLPGDARAEWISFPTPFDPKAHDSCRIDTVFHREFVADESTGATLLVRAVKHVDVTINNKPVLLRANENWKVIRSADVASLLHTGSNTIEARVVNDHGPSLLWLSLQTGPTTIRTDNEWQSSCAGSPWKKAGLAIDARLPGSGNPVGETEHAFSAFLAIWPIWFALGIIAAVICFGAARFVRGCANYPTFIGSEGIRIPPLSAGEDRVRVISNPLSILLKYWAGFCVGLASILWLALFWNNARLMPYAVGFDAQAHADYINYLQEHHSLPSPNEGYEMFQPPLYYALSAALLTAARVTVNDHSGIIVLRFIATVLAVANVWLVFLSLRLLLPNDAASQLAGLLCAALPMQLYLSHFITNETLAVTLMTAALFLTVRMLHSDRFSLFQFGLLGAVLGLALLTKSTALLLIPSIVLACTLRPNAGPYSVITRLRDVSTVLIACFLVCGWYYFRVWYRFGRPLIGNWEPEIGFNWWQDPGFHTARDYLRFGRSLSEPFFSSLYGFADGIYSTLWGDGLLSGTTSLDLRLPWNYNLMAAGYLLALVPTILIIVGGCVTLRKLFTGSAIWLFLLSYCAAVMLALFYITLLVPSYAQVKAFYGLSLLIPLSGLAATGWDVLTRRRKSLQLLFGIVLLIFASNSYAWAWIQSSSAQHVYSGIRLFLEQNRQSAIEEAEKAINPGEMNAQARAVLALLLSELDRPIKALEQAKRAVELNPSNAQCHLQLARVLANRGELEEAIQQARTAAEFGAEDSAARQELANFLLQSDSAEEACAVAKEGVAVAPLNAELHYTLALAAARTRDFATAANHFAYASMLRRTWAEAGNNLSRSIALMLEAPDAARQIGDAVRTIPDSARELHELSWVLATYPDDKIRNGIAAVELAKHGCNITNYDNPRLLLDLSAAYAETGRFGEAISTVEKAIARPRTTPASETDLAGLGDELLNSFKADRPYHSARAAP